MYLGSNPLKRIWCTLTGKSLRSIAIQPPIAKECAVRARVGRGGRVRQARVEGLAATTAGQKSVSSSSIASYGGCTTQSFRRLAGSAFAIPVPTSTNTGFPPGLCTSKTSEDISAITIEAYIRSHLQKARGAPGHTDKRARFAQCGRVRRVRRSLIAAKCSRMELDRTRDAFGA